MADKVIITWMDKSDIRRIGEIDRSEHVTVEYKFNTAIPANWVDFNAGIRCVKNIHK